MDLRKIILLLFISIPLMGQIDTNWTDVQKQLVRKGDLTKWDDIKFPATALSPQNKNDNVPTFDTTNIGFAFDSLLVEELYIIAQLPHNVDTSSIMYPHIHWIAPDTQTVAWYITYRKANVNSKYSSWVSDTIIVAAADTIDDHNVDSFTGWDASGTGLSTMYDIKIGRLGSHAQDLLNADAVLKEFDIHYLKNGADSTNEYSN